MKKFWNWKNKIVQNQDETSEKQERILFLNGTIAEESWFDDDVTPKIFKEELLADSGDCIAAAQIYNMLMEYKGQVTVKIDGLAASAASVIAMAGSKVLVSPVSMLMIHNPATIAFGDKAEFQKAIAMLSEVKESIINAYEIKTGLPRVKLAHLMDAESWMNANKAIELGFADGILKRTDEADMEQPAVSMMCSAVAVTNSLRDKLAAKCTIKALKPQIKERLAEECLKELNLLKNHI